MFCDLVDSTKLSSQLDPEEYRDVVRTYQTACTEVIRRYDGHVAQLLGDGLLVLLWLSHRVKKCPRTLINWVIPWLPQEASRRSSA